jgi:hypothetical protein
MRSSTSGILTAGAKTGDNRNNPNGTIFKKNMLENSKILTHTRIILPQISGEKKVLNTGLKKFHKNLWKSKPILHIL